MKSKVDVDKLEKLIGQLNGLHTEVSLLAKKSPNDGLNLFKMNLVNKVLKHANDLLVGNYLPFDDFSQFSQDALPTNSDVALILAQYLEQVERFRSDHVIYDERTFKWVYRLGGSPSDIQSKPPTKIGATRE
jgi:hypothetical protein